MQRQGRRSGSCPQTQSPSPRTWYLVSIGYALCTMHRVVIEAFACASRRVRSCMCCKSGLCPPIQNAKPRVNSVMLAVPSDKRASHLMMKKCTAHCTSNRESDCAHVQGYCSTSSNGGPTRLSESISTPRGFSLVAERRLPTTPTMVGQEVNKKWDLLSRHLEDTRHETCYANL